MYSPRKPLHSTIGKEQEKQIKYADIAKENEYRMIAFAMETYDGLGREAVQLLNLLASHSRQFTPQEFLRHAYDRLSVTLQASNADVSQMGMQQLNLARHVQNPHRHVHGEQRRSAPGTYTAHQYCQLQQDADRQESRLQSAIRAREVQDQPPMSEPAFVYDGRIAFVDFAADADDFDPIGA